MMRLLPTIILISSLQTFAANSAILATTKFMFYSTWAQNAFGILDMVTWSFDWIINYALYHKDEPDEVDRLKARIRRLHEEYQRERREETESALQFCDLAIGIIENRKNEPISEGDEENRKAELNEALRAVKRVFEEDDEDGTSSDETSSDDSDSFENGDVHDEDESDEIV